MKTPQDWQDTYWKLREGIRDIPKVNQIDQWELLIRSIQLDAFKDGLKHSLKLIEQNESPYSMDANKIWTFIEEEEEKLTALPPYLMPVEPRQIEVKGQLAKDIDECITLLEVDIQPPEVRAYARLLRARYKMV